MNKKEPARYEIETMTDMLKIPADRFDAFVVELKEWFGFVKATVDLAAAVGEALGDETPVKGIKMIWIDDDLGEKKLTINLKGPKGEAGGSIVAKKGESNV
jgi:hypothetical protein